MQSEAEGRLSSGEGASAGAGNRVQGRITFASIDEAKRNPGGVAGDVKAVELRLLLAGGERVYRQRVWVDETAGGRILRTSPAYRVTQSELKQ